jgi:uncharacterized membrane protein YdcZ (DUF606 family)
MEPAKGIPMTEHTAIRTRGLLGTRLRVTLRVTLFAGLLAVLLVGTIAPDVALAAQPSEVTFQAEERALGLGVDWNVPFWATIGGTLGMFLLIGVGYLYRRERGLDWAFQRPDAPHDDHH